MEVSAYKERDYGSVGRVRERELSCMNGINSCRIKKEEIREMLSIENRCSLLGGRHCWSIGRGSYYVMK
jgi:hypothetical protein